MNNDDKFTLLSKNKIKKDYVLDSKYKIGIPTDYAKFLGVVENDDKCCYWTCSSKNNIPYYVDENGNLKKFKLELNTNSKIALRPVLSYSDLKYITPKGVVTHDEHFTLIIEYGWYPQDEVLDDLSDKLELLFMQGKLKGASNSYYHYTGPKQLEVNPEYEFEGRYYVRMHKNKNPHEVGWYKWFEVKPVKWIVDEDNKLLISQKCLTSGTPYLHPDKNYYDGDFKKTDIYNFLNYYFKNNLLQRHNPLLLGNQTLFGNYFSQEKDEPLKFIKNYMYASNYFEKGLTDDISHVHSIGDSAFEACYLNELELPISVHNIGFKAFYNCQRLNLVLPSSLVYLNLVKVGENIAIISSFNAIFACKSVRIYNYDFDLPHCDKKNFKHFQSTQYEELNDLIEYILSKYKIKISEATRKFFDYKCREIILQLNKEADFNEIPKWKEMLIEYIIKYLYKRKPYLLIYKYDDLRNEIIEHITNFYIEKNLIKKENEKIVTIEHEIINEPSNNKPLQIMNNVFESKSEEEVLKLITNLKISKLDNIDIKILRNYGEKLKPFLDYISNNFSKIIFENNINENRIMIVKKELGNYNGKIENIDNAFLDNLNSFISDAITKSEDKENKLETLKKIMYAYILKLEEIYKELNNSLIDVKSDNLKDASDNYLINNVIENKKTSLEKNIETILQEYMQLSIMLVNEDNFLNNLIIIRDNLLPKLVLGISLTSDSINKRKQTSIIKEIYNLLDDKKDKKRKINLLQGIKETLSKNNLESKSRNRDTSPFQDLEKMTKTDNTIAPQLTLSKLYDSNDMITSSTKYMHLVDYMNTSDVDEKNMQQNNNFLNDAFWHYMDKQCPNIHRKGK